MGGGVGIEPGLRPNLRDESRANARARILQGASRAVVRSGLGATIDEVADEAGVSRRTVFRYFATHGELIVETIKSTVALIAEQLPAPPTPGQSVQSWLESSMVRMHGISRELVGRAFWDLDIEHPDQPPEVTAALAAVGRQRHTFASYIAKHAWTALGRTGSPPRWVLDAFNIHVTGFATYAFMEYSATETGRLSSQVLWAVLNDPSVSSGDAADR